MVKTAVCLSVRHVGHDSQRKGQTGPIDTAFIIINSPLQEQLVNGDDSSGYMTVFSTHPTKPSRKCAIHRSEVIDKSGNGQTENMSR